jgi:hypothetical protein
MQMKEDFSFLKALCAERSALVKPEILKREELSDMVGKCNKALKDESGMRRH